MGSCDQRPRVRTEGSATSGVKEQVDGQGSATRGPETMTNQQRIGSEAEAIQRAMELTRLDALRGVTASATRVTVTDDSTPFLAKQIIGRVAWRVELSKVSLELASALQGFHDPYRRKFFVLLDEETSKLLGIASKFDGMDPDMRPLASAASAEQQLTAEKEIYISLPVHDPPVRFLDALDAILSGGIGSPFLAKEIDASYVSHARMGAAPRDAWVITLRGLPPLPARGPGGDQVPVWQRNHMRNVVDATTGKVLFATNSPQPI